MKNRLFVLLALLAIVFCFISEKSYGQDARELSTLIKRADSLFWNAYNHCDVDGMLALVSSDIEFYHDRGGYTVGFPAFVESVKTGMCRPDRNFSLKREAIDETIEVFPLEKDSKIYGAIIRGEHQFYIVEPVKSPRLDGHARFTHLWMLQDGVWKMTRVLSFDHGPAVYKNIRKQIDLPAAILTDYVGKYTGTLSKEIIMNVDSGVLVMMIGEKKIKLYPQTENLFFMQERDLTFEFVKDGRDTKLIIREYGDVVEELRLVQ